MAEFIYGTYRPSFFFMLEGFFLRKNKHLSLFLSVMNHSERRIYRRVDLNIYLLLTGKRGRAGPRLSKIQCYCELLIIVR